MKYDCGALSANPRQSPIFRFMTEQNGSRKGWIESENWPESYAREATIFAHTPGISKTWIGRVVKMWAPRIRSLTALYPECVDMGFENILTATYDDAIRYCRNGPKNTQIPFWAVPFFMADRKSGKTWPEMRKIWGVRNQVSTTDFLRNHSHVLHSSGNKGWRQNVDA